jgi:hypothetical protein
VPVLENAVIESVCTLREELQADGGGLSPN